MYSVIASPGEKPCIACGRCLDGCPLFQATRREELSPKAKHLLAAGGQGVVEALDAAALAALCLGCGRCKDVCPQGLRAAEVTARLRAAHPGWRERLWKLWIERAPLLWPAARTLCQILPGVVPHPLARGLAPAAPSPVLRLSRLSNMQRPRPSAEDRRVALFSGCGTRHLAPGRDETARRLLLASGWPAPSTPSFVCCGATLAHAGLADAAGEMRRRNVLAWREADRPLLAVHCASCRQGLREMAGDADLFQDPAEAEGFAASVRSLASLLGGLRLETVPDAPPLWWHRPCHDRETPPSPEEGTRRFPDGALGQLLPEPLAGEVDRCCGLGGVMRLAAPEVSRRVGERAWEAVPRGALLITDCAGCALQLAATAPEGRRACHWLDIVGLDVTDPDMSDPDRPDPD